jgi:hypothetical protein
MSRNYNFACQDQFDALESRLSLSAVAVGSLLSDPHPEPDPGPLPTNDPPIINPPITPTGPVDPA